MNFADTKLRDWKNEYVLSILIGATESGYSSHWFSLDWDSDVWNHKPQGMFYSDYALQLLLDGKALEIVIEWPEERYEKTTLSLQQLIEGYELNQRERPFDADLESGAFLDALTYDCILQYALFKEIMFC